MMVESNKNSPEMVTAEEFIEIVKKEISKHNRSPEIIIDTPYHIIEKATAPDYTFNGLNFLNIFSSLADEGDDVPKNNYSYSTRSIIFKRIKFSMIEVRFEDLLDTGIPTNIQFQNCSFGKVFLKKLTIL